MSLFKDVKTNCSGFSKSSIPQCFCPEHSPNSKGNNINSSGTSRFWNKTIFWGQEQQKQKLTQISSGY